MFERPLFQTFINKTENYKTIAILLRDVIYVLLLFTSGMGALQMSVGVGFVILPYRRFLETVVQSVHEFIGRFYETFGHGCI